LLVGVGGGHADARALARLDTLPRKPDFMEHSA
jgi:hypothetical protein